MFVSDGVVPLCVVVGLACSGVELHVCLLCLRASVSHGLREASFDLSLSASAPRPCLYSHLLFLIPASPNWYSSLKRERLTLEEMRIDNQRAMGCCPKLGLEKCV